METFKKYQGTVLRWKVVSDWLLFYTLPKSEEAPLVRNEDDLFVIDHSPQDFVEVRKAEYVGLKMRVQRDRELLFTPSFLTGNTRFSSFPFDSQVLV